MKKWSPYLLIKEATDKFLHPHTLSSPNQTDFRDILIARKEITTLQSENYNLERQLFSYQRSLAMASVRGQSSEDGLPPIPALASVNGDSYQSHHQQVNFIELH